MLFIAVVLAACATSGSVSGKKADNYQGTVARLAVAVRDPGRQGAEGSPRSRPTPERGAADGAMIRATSELRATLPVRVPAAFSAAGVPTVLVQGPEDKAPRASPAGTTHVLIVQIGSSTSTCSHNACVATVNIESRLLDLRAGATAWTGQMSIVEESGKPGSMATTVSEQLVGALRRDGLIR
jgi:hypothetical protein